MSNSLDKQINQYNIAVKMYEQYQKDVAKVGTELNGYQLLTLQLLKENIRDTEPKPLNFYQKVIGAFKNRKY